MPPKVRRVYICRSCAATQTKWMGKCPDCGAWDSLEETTVDPSATKDPHASVAWTLAQAAREEGDEGLGGLETLTPASGARALAQIDAQPAGFTRIPSGIAELDRTLGFTPGGFTPAAVAPAAVAPAALSGPADGAETASAGLVAGSAVLLGGEPGIGKSTLLMQAALAWARRGVRVLSVSSEESAEQVAARARRISGGDAPSDALFLLHDTNLARILEQARKIKPRVLIIDSVQMIYRADVPAAPGSVTQLRRCCAELVQLAKLTGTAVILVGHVTKDGRLAGPRLLEHLVDTVLSFEGDRGHAHRVVRSVKNRFGSTLEIGLFEMSGAGLREVEAGGLVRALADRTPRPGCALAPILTGSRCVLVEVQALTATGFLGAAKRKSSGLDASRLAMLIAVLEQHAELRLADRDIFASSVGGVRVLDPAADLAVLLAVAGSHLRKALPVRTCVVGEVGLTGEVRSAPLLEQRVREAARLGCEVIVTPALGKAGKSLQSAVGSATRLVECADVNRAIQVLGT